jgi:hypothetical protein
MSYGTDILAEGKAPITMYHQVYAAIWERHALKGMTDHSAFWRRVFEVLSPGERAFVLAHEFFCSFSDGGYDGYFFEGGGYTRAHEAVRLFRRVGLTQAADCLQKAIEVAGIPDPLPGEYEYASPESGLEEAEQAYRKARRSEDFEGSLVSYFKQHVEEFA